MHIVYNLAVYVEIRIDTDLRSLFTWNASRKQVYSGQKDIGSEFESLRRGQDWHVLDVSSFSLVLILLSIVQNVMQFFM